MSRSRLAANCRPFLFALPLILVSLTLANLLLLPYVGWDFWVYVNAAHDVLTNHNPYVQNPDSVMFAGNSIITLPFFNPLPAAIPFVPLAVLPHDLVKVAWILSNFVALGIIAYYGTRLTNLRVKIWQWPGILWLCSIVCEPALSTLQPTVWMMAIIILSLRYTRWGTLLALVLIKPHIGGLAFVALLVRKPALRLPAALLVGLGLLVTFALRPNWVGEYIESLKHSVNDVTAWSMTSFPQWATGALGLPSLSVALLYAALLTGTTWVLWRMRHADTVMLVAAALAATLLCTPYSRGYDWALLVLPLMLIVTRLRKHLTVLIGAGVLLYVLLFLHNGSHELVLTLGWPISALISCTFFGLYATKGSNTNTDLVSPAMPCLTTGV